MAIGTDSPIHDSLGLYHFIEPTSQYKSQQQEQVRNSKKSTSLPISSSFNPRDGLKRSRKYKTRFLEIFKDIEIHPMDLEPGYEYTLKTLSFDVLDSPLSCSSYLEMGDSDKDNSLQEEPIQHLLLHSQDRALRKDVKRYNYGETLMKQIQDQIVHHLELQDRKVLSFQLKDSLLRCILHACCRYYGLESCSKSFNDFINIIIGSDDSLGRRVTMISLTTSKSRPCMDFCEYFYTKN